MDENTIKEIFGKLIEQHDLDEFLKHCTKDVKFILHPKHVAAGIYDRKTIYNLFVHLGKSFPFLSTLMIEVSYIRSTEVSLLCLSRGQTFQMY